MYYNSCPFCGANLDPGESCDCQEQRQESKLDVQVADSSSENISMYEEVGCYA